MAADMWHTLGNSIILLAACLISGGLVSRLGQSPIIGYLLAGLVLGGPGSLNIIGSEKAIEAIAELGVALLLFSLGLEFSINRLKQLGWRPLVGGTLQVLLTAVLASGATWLLGLPPQQAIALGMMLCLSSTAVVLRMLMERAELDLPHGRNCLAVLLIQDIAVVPLALIMSVLGSNSSPLAMAGELGRLGLLASGLVITLFVLNRVAMLALGTLTLHRNRELTIIFAVVAGLGSAWAAHYAGISPALGAFVSGMMLGNSAFATQIRADVASLRVLLLTLFFGSAGMLADPVWMLQNAGLVLGLTLLVTLGKGLIIWAIFKALGQTTRVAASTGLCLAQVGEFSFVLGSIGRLSGVVSAELYALVISITLVSFLLSAVMVGRAQSLGNWLARFEKKPTALAFDDNEHISPACDIVLIGFGPAGQIAAQPFVDKPVRVGVIDLNREGVQLANDLGFHGTVGDATQLDVLEHEQLNKAKAVIITIPHHESALAILEGVKHLAPHARVFVRSRYQRYQDEFEAAGACVLGDEQEVGRGLANAIEDWLEEAPACAETQDEAKLNEPVAQVSA